MCDLHTVTLQCCTCCGGDTVIEHFTGWDRNGNETGWRERCDACEGTGGELVPCIPIELEDLEEM